MMIEGKIRKDILEAAKSTGRIGAHIASSLSLVEIMSAIFEIYDNQNDSIILSKGHGALGMYASMHQYGIISDEQFFSFEKNGGEFPGQPCKSKANRIEYSSGSLGMGLPYAVGVAEAKKTYGKVYVVLGDGEMNEGSNWEAVALAKQLKLGNLIAVIDSNKMQSEGRCADIICMDLEAIFNSYGWRVISCDGHNRKALKNALIVGCNKVPVVIVANTIKGMGVSFMENNNEWHHHTLSNDEYNMAVKEIGERYGLF